MTTDIRDGVVWKPWWIRYASYGDESVVLSDAEKAGCSSPRYYVSSDRITIGGCPSACGCGRDIPHALVLFSSDDLSEAEAAFFAEEARLLGREEQG